MRIRFYGHLRAGFGLSGGARATARVLEAAGCQLNYEDLALTSHAAVQSVPNNAWSLDENGPSPLVDLVHTNPNILSSNPEFRERISLTAPLRIGYWAWELEQFPAGWERFFVDYHEIWCPSSFTAQSLAQRAPLPVIAVPHLPNWPHLNKLAIHRNHYRRQNPSRVFTFLTLFDFWSTLERKNPLAVIQAFQQAFPTDDSAVQSVQLVIKASSTDQFPQQFNELKTQCQGDTRIRWITELLPQAELDLLYSQADALVSLHRAEGFGLTLADAMAIGLPVIATGYSGNLDFMPPGSAVLIPWQPKKIERTYGDYVAGAFWADPDVKAAARAMKQLVSNRSAAQQFAAAGRRAVQERLSGERISAVVRQRLARWILQPTAKQTIDPAFD